MGVGVGVEIEARVQRSVLFLKPRRSSMTCVAAVVGARYTVVAIGFGINFTMNKGSITSSDFGILVVAGQIERSIGGRI